MFHTKIINVQIFDNLFFSLPVGRQIESISYHVILLVFSTGKDEN